MTPRVPRLLFVALAAAGTLTPEALAAAPRYKMVVDAATPEHGVQTVSLVQNPAIQRGWVALSAVSASPKRVHLSTATEGPQKQVVTGPALIPGQEIVRLDAQGNPFYIVFDEANIEATARRFAAQGQHNNSNQDHAIALQGNVIYESWIVTDPANDKSAALGLEPVAAGTWMLSMHVPDEAFWLSEVVTGKATGFSIEGLFDTQQLNLSAVDASPNLDLAVAWLKASIDLHSKHMDGTAPTTGADGEASQATMMGQMQGALTALTGEAAAPMAMAATKKKPMPGMKMTGVSLCSMNYFEKIYAKLSALDGEKSKEICLALGMEMLADGRQLNIDDTSLAVTVIGPDGVPGAPLPDGTYQLQNGGELVVQQGKRADNGGQGAPASTVVDAAAPDAAAAADAAAVPAPLADTATTADIAKAVNSILDFLKKDKATDKAPEQPTCAPAAPKMAAALHGVKLADVAAKFTELKLDAIELESGDKLTLNPVSRRLSNADGSLVESGYFAAADGSYFCVSTDQWFYQIDKQTYDAVYTTKLQAVELAEAKLKLAQEPAANVIKLHGDTTADASTAQLAPHLLFLHSVRQANGKK